MREFWRFGHKYGPNCIFFHCACAKRPHFYFRSKIWRQHRVPRPQFLIGRGNFGNSVIYKGQVAYFFHCACAKRQYSYVRSKIWRHHRVPRPRFPIGRVNFGDSVINKFQIAYFSLRMREMAIFLLPVKNLTSPSCSPTPISYKTREFWRYVNI